MRIEFTKHKDCDNTTLLKILELKQQYWDYSLDSQLRWIKENFADEDIHILILNSNILIAYLSLTNLQTRVDNVHQITFGVGSVCVNHDYAKKGYGYLIMQSATSYLKQQGVNGVLLCKDHLVDFYKKCNWKLFEGRVKIKEDFFNYNLFTQMPTIAKEIEINRLF